MKAGETENRFEAGFQQPKNGLPKATGINMPTYYVFCIFLITWRESL